jgi:hypothetical protein
MARYRYISCHPITRVKLATLHPNDPSWNTTVNGNGTFSASFIVPPEADVVTLLRPALEPDQAAIYVKDKNGKYPWGGPIIEQSWDPSTGAVSITAVEWRAWFSSLFLPPKTDLTANITYSWTATDQLQIARELAGLVTSAGAADGRPTVVIGSELSGKTRDLNFTGMDFKTAADAIDSMANRDTGFEWTLEVRPHPVDGLPLLYFVPYFPQRGTLVGGLNFKKTAKGANNLKSYGPVVKSSADRRVRQWATGNGTPPDVPFTQDTDPNFVVNQLLMREAKTSYSTVIDRATLTSNARAERQYWALSKNLLTVKTTLDRPDVTSYTVGDRGALRIEDRWLGDAYDLPAVRIIDKKISPGSEGGEAELTLDLDDYTLPEVDTGGGV